MRPIITPEQVVALAFRGGEYLPPNIISDSDIIAAQERYITPIVGADMINLLMEGDYEELTTDFIAPTLAIATRLLVQPMLNLRMGESGLFAPRGEAMEEPSQSATKALMSALKLRTRQLLKVLSRHLDENSGDYPEYNPKYNILNRCSIDGGFVQIF